MPDLIFHPVASVRDIPEGTSLSVRVLDEAVLVCHVQGSFLAVQNRCTHANVSLEYARIEGVMVICPMHNARYDLRTGISAAPFLKPLASYQVRIEGDNILIGLRAS